MAQSHAKSNAKKELIEHMEVSKGTGILMTIALTFLSLVFIFPILLVLLNSFKNKLYISDAPFALPNGETFSGLFNYTNGIGKTGLIAAAGRSLFITVFSVIAIVLLTSMAAWWIARVKSKFSDLLYYMFVFAMIVPFQMVMFTLSKVTDMLNLGNMFGIIFVYVGFGAGLSVFMFTGFVKSIPISLEEAAMIDGCSPIQIFFRIIVPVLRPTMITVAILNAMWVWNDYLLPTLVLDSDAPTIPMAVQYLRGGYGSIDMGAMMAMLVLAIVPIIVFYLSCQKYIIKGVAAGAVKG
ncbi:MAG: carbohydrate ABC transporter permease [Lachnospiraceae bacterium]|nr:carbohydrate ABC transporter permease [Lachnospiraceae bacterium]